MSDTIAEFRARLDIIAAAEKLGLSVSPSAGGGKILCPIHAEDSPSCNLYSSDNHYHCYGCAAHGSIFDLVAAVRGISFGEAMDWLATTFALPAPARDPQAAARSAALRALRARCAEGLGDAGILGVNAELARSLGLGRAAGLGALASEYPALALTPRERQLWEGRPTVELSARGGVVAVGAILERPDGSLSLDRPVGLHFPAFAFLSGARQPIVEGGMVLHSWRLADALAAQASGVRAVVSAGRVLSPDHALELAALARRVVLVLRPGDPAPFEEMAAVLAAGALVRLAAWRDGTLGPAVSLDRYLGALAARGRVQPAQIHDLLEAVSSPSSRELYRLALLGPGASA
jgi:hypothetical protein